MKRLKFLLLLALLLGTATTRAWEYDGRHGWPTQKAPTKLIVCNLGESNAEAMLAQSLAGLAAQAVNESRFDEMVWFDTTNPSYEKIYASTIDALNIKDSRRMDVWSMAKYLKDKKVIKGYILYNIDETRANAYGSHENTDYSCNVATVYAGLLKGVLIDKSLEAKAKAMGLRQLKDASTETMEECFANTRSKLNNYSALSVPPSVYHMRDYAIAHKLMLYADNGKFIDTVLEWVRPLSPILGWGCGDEYDFTSVIARWGHYNSASNWCLNLPVISSASGNVELKKIEEVGLKDINFRDTSSFHTFVMSDGDNVQWTMGDIIENPAYLGNKDRANVGMSWTLCPINLSTVSPFTWNALADIKTPNMSYLEYGGGYQYPDIFAANRPNRPELLREFARRINYHLDQLGLKIFGFICWDVASAEAQQAFQIYAEEMKNITGMLAVQYFPYELDGAIYWKTNKEGVDIPVVTSRYSIWDEVNPHRPRAGTPEFIASLINRDVLSTIDKRDEQLQWTIVHAWSHFDKSSKMVSAPTIGFNPVKVTEDMLIDDIKTVSANELLWRIRMKYRPEQTQKLLNKN